MSALLVQAVQHLDELHGRLSAPWLPGRALDLELLDLARAAVVHHLDVEAGSARSRADRLAVAAATVELKGADGGS